MSGIARALLVEVVNADQTPGRISSVFPLLSGLLASAGVATRWLRFGIATTNLLQHGRDEITLSDDDLATLLAALEQHRPDVLYATDALYEAQRAAVEARVAGRCHWRVQITAPDEPGLPAYRGVELLERPDLRPDYGWEAGNTAARRREIDNAYLLTVESCGHRYAVDRNPCYRDLVDDERVALRRGCSFCSNWAGPEGVIRRTPAEWVARQIEALATTRRPENGPPNALLLTRLEDPALLDACFEALARTGLAAHTRLLVAVRTDRAQAFERFTRAGLEAHAASGLRVGVYASGIESFSAADLARFNKQTSPEDGVRAIATFRRLAADFPGRFSYEGLTFILFTPWTTLESLRLNVGLLGFLRVTEIGNLFEARLRLHPDLPITALAERDGVLIDHEPDPVLVSNRRKLFERELPWRFLEPRLTPLARLALRVDLPPDELDDPLVRLLCDRLAAAGVPRRQEARLELLLALVDAARAEPGVLDEATLLDRALALWAKRQTPPQGSPEAPFRVGERRVSLDGLLDALAPVVASGPGEVASWDLPPGTGLAAASRERVRRLGAHARVLERTGAVRRATLMLARSAEALERAADLSTRMDRGGADADGALHELGRLHGVPACCAEAWGRDAEARALGTPWAAWARRCDATGPVPVETNPLLVPSLAFVPCRADCPDAARVYRAWGQALHPELLAPGDERAFVAPLDAPDDGDLVPLRLAGGDDTEWPYALDEPPTDALARTLAAGDRLTFEAGQVRVAAGRQTVELFTASVVAWSPTRVAHPAAWRALAEARAQQRGGAAAAGPAPAAEPSPAPVVERLLAGLLARFAAELGGLALAAPVDASRPDELRVELRVEGRPLGLVLRPRSGDTPCWLTTDRFAVSHRPETPPASPGQRRSVQALCRALDRALQRRAPEVLRGEGR